MIVRLVTYRALPDKDVEGWMRDIASELRGVSGMRHVEFVRSLSDPFGSVQTEQMIYSFALDTFANQ